MVVMPQGNPSKRFFMNGDEWGLYDVQPAENVEDCRRINAEYREHHKDTKFSLHGWTTPPYVIPPAAVSIAVRNLRVADLESILGRVMPRAAGVDSCVDFTGTPFPCPNSFAFGLSLENYWQCEGFYGDQQNEIVQTLYVTPSLAGGPSAQVVDVIVQLGRKFDLILLANAEDVVDLRSAEAVEAFIAGEAA
jgi:hypothetical protein